MTLQVFPIPEKTGDFIVTTTRGYLSMPTRLEVAEKVAAHLIRQGQKAVIMWPIRSRHSFFSCGSYRTAAAHFRGQ